MVQTEVAHIENLSQEDINKAHRIMLHAYAVTEIEIWGENYERMSFEEFVGLIEKGELILAKIDGKIVGSIHVYPLRDNVFCFGLLSADFSKKGLGIGRALVSAAEKRAMDQGAELMSIEILKPRDLFVPVKQKLKEWYERMGYTFKRSQLFEERKPHKAKKALNLIRPCVFDIYEKPLN